MKGYESGGEGRWEGAARRGVPVVRYCMREYEMRICFKLKKITLTKKRKKKEISGLKLCSFF